MDNLNELMPQSGQKAILEDKFENVFIDKFPGIPDSIKDLIAKIAPWGYLILAIFGIFSLLVLMGVSVFGTAASVLGGDVVGGGFFFITTIILGVVILLSIIAVPSLLKHGRTGWVLIYYAWLLSLLNTFISNTFLEFDISGLILGFIFFGFAMYIHFQIRDRFLN